MKCDQMFQNFVFHNNYAKFYGILKSSFDLRQESVVTDNATHRDDPRAVLAQFVWSQLYASFTFKVFSH